MKDKFNNQSPLTPAVFHIMLALIEKERHGYDIMQQVIQDSDGKVSMGPGTLYGSIDRMIEADFVEKSSYQPDEPRRIYYQLTVKGKKVFQAEVERITATLKIANQRKLRAV